MGAGASKQTINKTARKLGAEAVARTTAQPAAGPTSATPLVDPTRFAPRAGSAPSPSTTTTSDNSADPTTARRPDSIQTDGMDPQYLARVQQLGAAVSGSIGGEPVDGGAGDGKSEVNSFDRVLRDAGISNIPGSRNANYAAAAPGESPGQSAAGYGTSAENEWVSALKNRSTQDARAHENLEASGDAGRGAAAAAAGAAVAPSPVAAAGGPQQQQQQRQYLHPQTLSAVLDARDADGDSATRIQTDFNLAPATLAKIGARLRHLPKGASEAKTTAAALGGSSEGSGRAAPGSRGVATSADFRRAQAEAAAAAPQNAFAAQLGQFLQQQAGAEGSGAGAESADAEMDALEELKRQRMPRRKQKSPFHVSIDN